MRERTYWRVEHRRHPSVTEEIRKFESRDAAEAQLEFLRDHYHAERKDAWRIVRVTEIEENA